MDPKSIFQKYCKTNGLRYTPERGVIIDEIYRRVGHFDVDVLFQRIKRRYPKIKIAKASIYRSIPHFIRSGLIRESFHDNGRSCYEQSFGQSHHDHMKCLACGKILEFTETQVDRLQQKVCRQNSFILASHIHILYGYCADCARKNKRTTKIHYATQ